jgi:N-acetylmuramoyl-L-alanine amidase
MMKSVRLFSIGKFFLGAALMLLSASVLFSALTAPREKIIWSRDGSLTSVDRFLLDGQPYILIDQLSSSSQSQLHYRPVSEEACLGRVNGTMCFNWKTQQVSISNGTSVPCAVRLLDDNLLIPFDFVTSATFATFSRTKLSWDQTKKTLTQNSPITLSLPAVQNLGDRYRFSLPVDDRTSYELLEKNNKRIWLRFIHGRSEGSQVLEGDSVVREVRVNQHRGSADLIIKMGANALLSEVTADSERKLLIIDVFLKNVVAQQEPKIVPAEKKITATSAVVPGAKPAMRPVIGPIEDKKIRTIVVDAGHGGVDCGAIGARGTFEKEINLRVAKDLAQLLSKQENTRVILTREKDEFVTLHDRTEIANKAKADLFISIHCNSSLSVNSTGFEVYILSPDASDEAAAAVARIENSVVSLESKKNKKASKLDHLLASMAVYNFINESSKCAAYICRGVQQKTSVKKTSVREANFHVLRGAQMPGVLVELEYLSNPISEVKLRSSRFNDQVVKGIAEGVMLYDKAVRLGSTSKYEEARKPGTRELR